MGILRPCYVFVFKRRGYSTTDSAYHSALENIETLIITQDANGQPTGFAGIAERHLEMLFIHPNFRKQGLGRKMLETAVRDYGVRSLDVNEQNPEAFGFYRHLGFEVLNRSAMDDYGNPFPILHMVLRNHS